MIFLSVLLLSSSLIESQQITPTTFHIISGQGELNYHAGSGFQFFSDSKSTVPFTLSDSSANDQSPTPQQLITTYTGSIESKLTLSENNIICIEFVSGIIQTSDMTWSKPTSFNSNSYFLTVGTQNITRTIQSSTADEISDGLSFKNHSTQIQSGNIQVSNFSDTSPAVIETLNADLSSTTYLFKENLFNVNSKLTLSEPIEELSTVLATNYTVTLSFFFETSTTQPIDVPPFYEIPLAGGEKNQLFRQLLNESGAIQAVAQFSIPTEFGQWAIDNDLNLITGLEKNAHNVSYKLIHAFGVPVNSSILPVTADSTSSTPTIIANLPANGLNSSIRAEYSSNLKPNSWLPLPEANYSGGAKTLDSGATGAAYLTFPTTDKGFIRLFTTDQ